MKLGLRSLEVKDDVASREAGILALGEEYKKSGNAEKLAAFIRDTRPFLREISKAKAARLVRSLVDMLLDLEGATELEVTVCRENIEWAKQEHRTFLRQSLEAGLVCLFFETKQYTNSLTLSSQLLSDLKKLDDKNLLVEVQLFESKTYHALGNLPKARAALTSARTTANGIYCAPKLQSSLDLQSGILHAAEEKDFKTAYSYFYEAFEQYDSVEDKLALTALKYMLMSKIMLRMPEEVHNIVSGKLALKYSGTDIEAMKLVAQASKKRSLADFQTTVGKYSKELKGDKIVARHLDTLYQTMLEQNLCRIIEPYSRVQVKFVAEKIDLPEPEVEKKLSQMILDKKFQGILDQETRVLIIFEASQRDETYDNVIETVGAMSKVVDRLYQAAQKLT